MPSPAEMGVRTIYRPDGSNSGNYPPDLLEQDKKALSCNLCEESPQPKPVFLSEGPRVSKPIFVKQIEAQAATKTS